MGQEKVFFTKKGSIVVGDGKKFKPEFALQIETKAKEGSDANSVYIGRGGLNLKGGIFKMSTYKGKPIVWRLYPAGFSNMKGVGIKGRLAVGTAKAKTAWKVYLEKGRTLDIGSFGFAYSTGETGTLSFNEYVVSKDGQQQVKLHNKKEFACAMRLHNDGHVGLGTTTAAEDLTVKTSNPDSHLYFTSDKAPGKIAKFTMLAGGSMRLSADGGSIKSGKFEVKEFRGLAFTNAGGKAKTIFDRGGKPAGLKKGVEFKAPLVEFRSGNVGIGVKTAQKMLHVGGSHWSQGSMIVKGGFTQIKKSMMEFTSFLQTGEGDSDGTDVGALVKHLAGLVRKNKQRLHKQASSIAFMEREVSALRAR